MSLESVRTCTKTVDSKYTSVFSITFRGSNKIGKGGVAKLFKFYRWKDVFFDFFLTIIASSGE